MSNLTAEYGDVHATELSIGYDSTIWGVLQAFSDTYDENVLAFFNREEKTWYPVTADAG